MFAETTSRVNKFHTHVSSLFMLSLHAIDLNQNYFKITVISSKISLFAPPLVIGRFTLLNNLNCRIEEYVIEKNDEI